MTTSRLLTLILILGLATLPAALAQPPAFDQPVLLGDLAPGPDGSTIRFILPIHDRAVFLLLRETPEGEVPELWATDGTPGGTQTIQPGGLTLHVDTINFWTTPDFVLFSGEDTEGGRQGIWRTDGTEAGTVKLVDGAILDTPYPGSTASGLVVFTTRNQGDSALTLWATDGTAAGTVELRELGLTRTSSPAFHALHELGGDVYFLDGDAESSTAGLWKTDGTEAGTELVLAPETTSFHSIAEAESALWLTAIEAGDGAASLWISDGTAGGTARVHDFGPAIGTSDLDYRAEVPSGKTFWVVETQAVAPSFWVSDGTEQGTQHLADLPSFRAIPHAVQRLGETIFFTITNADDSRDLWRSDGTPAGTEAFFEGMPDPESGLSFLLWKIDGRLILSVKRPDLGFEPWISDGTTDGTHLLADVCPGPCYANSSSWLETGGPVLFWAGTPSGNSQIFTTDLTAAGTRQVTHFADGVLRQGVIRDGSIGQQLLLGDRLLFTANDEAHGTELWSLDLPKTQPLPPPGPWLSSGEVPGFEVKVRITPPGEAPVTGSIEPTCIAETACISGALPGRSEVFVRVVGPKPNGFLWPTLVKFTTSQVEVWIHQPATDVTRYYLMEGARPDFDELPGLFDRTGFEP